MLAFTVQSVVRGMLTWSVRPDVVEVVGEGADPGLFLFLDVEKAFDNMRYDQQFSSMIQCGFPRPRAFAYMCELLHSEAWVRMGDVEVGPLAHARGKQGNCGTPHVFNAMMSVILEPCLRMWRDRGWGIRVLGVGAGHTRFCAGLFADNLVLAGTAAQLRVMYRQVSTALGDNLLR